MNIESNNKRIEMPNGNHYSEYHLENKEGEVVAATSPESSTILGGNHESVTHEEDTDYTSNVTTEESINTKNNEEVSSIREKILAARKKPDEVARLIGTQNEQLTIPVFKRPPDGSFWRVRGDGDWDPMKTEVLLLHLKDGGAGPEFLLVVTELESLFKSDPRLRNMVAYYHLAFVVNNRQSIGWWAVPSRSDNAWHVSSRSAMRFLIDKWGMVKANMNAKAYQIEKPDEDLGKPSWAAGSHDDLFIKGFSDKVLDSQDHPVLRELQGRK